jgi:glutaconate CoA-transferase subunit B
VFRFDRGSARFALASVHPGHTVDEIRAQTGFAFDLPGSVEETPAPTAETLDLIRGRVGKAIAETYPRFAAQVLDVAAAGEA